MNCPLETRGNTEPLVAYSAQRLDAAEAAPLEKHLAECARCSEFVHGQQAVWQVLDTWEAEPVSADFDRRLYRRIRQNLSWWDRVLQSMQPLLVHRGVPVVATAALVVVAGVLLDRTTAPDPTPVRTAAVQQAEGLQPEQVVQALDEMDTLSQFNRSLKADGSQPRM